MDQTTNREYEYKGLCINGFLMIFFTFILLPAYFHSRLRGLFCAGTQCGASDDILRKI